MTYDDDEFTKAALLAGMSQTEGWGAPAPPMPSSLEKKILERAYALAAERRYSTTAAGAISLEAVPESTRAPHSSPVRAWVGWVAAAACFAFAVYEWRVGANVRASNVMAASSLSAAPAAQRPPRLTALGTDGRHVAELRTGDDPRSGELLVSSLPASAAGEHYRVWLSSLDRENAASFGSFSCAVECKDRVFSLPLDKIVPARHFWITRSGTTDAWKLEAGAIVAAGQRDPGQRGAH